MTARQVEFGNESKITRFSDFLPLAFCRATWPPLGFFASVMELRKTPEAPVETPSEGAT